MHFCNRTPVMLNTGTTSTYVFAEKAGFKEPEPENQFLGKRKPRLRPCFGSPHVAKHAIAEEERLLTRRCRKVDV
jgi:hypothetical protein